MSKTGLSQVVVIFADDVDTYFARQLVFERLQLAKEQLPPGVQIDVARDYAIYIEEQVRSVFFDMALATLLVIHTDHPHDSDIVELGEDGRIRAIGRLDSGKVSGSLSAAAICSWAWASESGVPPRTSKTKGSTPRGVLRRGVCAWQ